MCVAKKYTDRLKGIVDDMRKESVELGKMNSEFDLELNKMYHEIEVANFSASAGYIKMKELQEVLRKRRLIKQEIHIMDSVKKSFNIPQMQSAVAKSENSINQIINGEKGNLVYTDGWNITFADLVKSK